MPVLQKPVLTDAWVLIGATTTPVFSKDGTTLFHLRGAGLPQVWSMRLDGSEARQLSFHEEKVAFLRRSPVDDTLIWGIDAGGDECQQLIMLKPGGEPHPLTATPSANHDFGAWSSDGARIAFAANDRDIGIFDVVIMDLATQARTRIEQAGGSVTVPGWTPDMKRLLMIEDYSSSDQRPWLIDTTDNSARRLPRRAPTRFASLRFIEDGAALMGLCDAGSDVMRLCRIDPASGAYAVIFEAPGRDLDAWSQSPDGTQLATIENDRGYAILRVGPHAAPRAEIAGLPHGVVADLAWSPDSTTLAFTVQAPTAPPAIWLARDGHAAPIPVDDPLSPSGIARADLIEPEPVEWDAPDGLRIPGWFALPRTPRPASGHPAVVWVHGGPAGQTRANFRPDIQMLLAQGFAVMMPNARGSTGYGRAYMEADDVGKRPLYMDDLAAGHAWLAAHPDIDASRIGIMGQSYGGWAVLAAVTLQPELWKVAVDYYGIADFTTLLERTGPWRRNHRAREYGFAESDAALFERISPIRHIDRVIAPMLLLHGDRDPRVPMHESDQFAEALELRQKKVTYERFTYAGHGFIRPEHRRRVYAAVAGHFGEHL